MKKIIFLTILIITTILQSANAKENIIREIGVTKADGAVFLNVKSDYKEPYKEIRENNGTYYVELKDAKLAEGYNTNSIKDIGILTQEIGSKVRIYLLGNNLGGEIQTNLISEKGQKPYDYSLFGIAGGVFALLFLLALKFYSDTIKLAIDGTSISRPCEDICGTALNKRLLSEKIQKPQIAKINKTNPIKQEVFVDFEYAKNKKNIKVAI